MSDTVELRIFMLKDVLVVGGRAREHALQWKLSGDTEVGRVYCAPGNGGTQHNVPISETDIEGLARFAKENNLFTVVGPELPIAMGIANHFWAEGLGICAPTREAARLETSKAWCKEFLAGRGIPTPQFKVFDDPEMAKEHVRSVDYKVVVKADGLCEGKGVIVCDSAAEAEEAIERLMVRREFGDAGAKVVIEKRLYGEERSFMAISDGTRIEAFASSRDYKKLQDNDEGPNTGGMGAYSPAPAGPETERQMYDIAWKIVTGMRDEGFPFVGFIYVGFMIVGGKPQVLEINSRLGDPETETLVRRMDSPLFPYIEAAAHSSLDETVRRRGAIRWKNWSAVTVVLASKGYPDRDYARGEAVTFRPMDGMAYIFHAGTKKVGGGIVTDGGRNFAVTALGRDLEYAAYNAYEAVESIRYPSKILRRDIARNVTPAEALQSKA